MFNRFQRVPFSISNSGRHGGKFGRERERRSNGDYLVPKNSSSSKSTTWDQRDESFDRTMKFLFRLFLSVECFRAWFYQYFAWHQPTDSNQVYVYVSDPDGHVRAFEKQCLLDKAEFDKNELRLANIQLLKENNALRKACQ